MRRTCRNSVYSYNFFALRLLFTIYINGIFVVTIVMVLRLGHCNLFVALCLWVNVSNRVGYERGVGFQESWMSSVFFGIIIWISSSVHTLYQRVLFVWSTFPVKIFFIWYKFLITSWRVEVNTYFRYGVSKSLVQVGNINGFVKIYMYT